MPEPQLSKCVATHGFCLDFVIHPSAQTRKGAHDWGTGKTERALPVAELENEISDG